MRLHREFPSCRPCCWATMIVSLVFVRPVGAQQPRLLGKLGDPATAYGEERQAMAFSPDGRWLAAAWRGKVRIYDVEKRTLHADIAAHRDSEAIVAFSPDSKVLASGIPDDKALIRLWDSATGEKIREFDGPACRSFVFDPTGKFLATTALNCEAAIWNYETGKRVLTVGGSTHGPTKMLSITPDGKTLATMTEYGVAVWRPHAGKGDRLKFVITSAVGTRGVPVSQPKKAPALPSQFLLSSMAFSPDGRTLACCGGDKGRIGIELWDVESQKSIKTLMQDEPATKSGSIKRAVFSASGETLLTLQVGIHGWDAETGRSLFLLNEPKNLVANSKGEKKGVIPFVGMALSADGRLLATAGSNIPIRLWELPAGLERPTKSEGKFKQGNGPDTKCQGARDSVNAPL